MTSSATRKLDAAEALLDHESNTSSEVAGAAFGAVQDGLRYLFAWRGHEDDWSRVQWATTDRVRRLLALARELDALMDPESPEEDERLLAVVASRLKTTSGELVDLDDVVAELNIDLNT